MPTIVLLRHGRTTANASGILAGWAPAVHLDSTGVDQAARVAGRWQADRPAAIVSSPLPRCLETASAFGTDVEVHQEARLGECHYGAWTGRPLRDLAAEPLWRTVQDDPEHARFPDHPDYRAESLPQMRDRALAALTEWDQRIAAEHGPTAVWVAVSHGDVIKALVAEALGSGLRHFQRIVVDPASVSILRWGDRPAVARVNDTGTDPITQAELHRFDPVRKDGSEDAAAEHRSAAGNDGDGIVGGGAGAP